MCFWLWSITVSNFGRQEMDVNTSYIHSGIGLSAVDVKIRGVGSHATHSPSPASRKNRKAQLLPCRPRGATIGTPERRKIAEDFGGNAGVKQAPDSRMRDSKPTPGASACVIPEMSTMSCFPARMDFAVFHAYSRSFTRSPTSSPRRTNRNIVALSCWYMFIGVYRRNRRRGSCTQRYCSQRASFSMHTHQAFA